MIVNVIHNIPMFFDFNTERQLYYQTMCNDEGFMPAPILESMNNKG